MSRIGPVIVFIFTIVVAGLYWATWDACRSYLDSIVINDPYYILMYWIWRMIPAVILFIGIMCLISAGISRGRERVVDY